MTVRWTLSLSCAIALSAVVARTELSDDQRRVSVAPTCDAFVAS